MEMVQRSYWVVENLDSKDFYLEFDHADDTPSFQRGVEYCSKYNSEDMANMVIERIQSKGFNFKNLKPRKLEISYKIY
jgi:hypothetical protein